MNESWESATVTVTYDDLTDGAPKQQHLTVDRRTLIRARKNRLIDAGHAADAVGFDISPDEFEFFVMQHAISYMDKPLVVEDQDSNTRMVLPATAILRVDVEPSNQPVAEGEEAGLPA